MIAVAAARPEAKVTARPPSRAPSATSSADQPALPSRPYSMAASCMYVDDIVIGMFMGAPGSRAGRPACTATVSGDHDGARPTSREDGVGESDMAQGSFRRRAW